MTITTGTGWEGIGTHRALCGERVFTIDAPSIGPERHAPLLVLHGFPTSSFDYAAVLDGLRAGRRVLLLDMVGYGLSSKPDRAYSMALQADVAAAFVAALGIERLALLTHDMGDTVGGELLARRAEGSWAVDVTRRVVTNGSIYIEQAHLTNGQQLLLGLPDEILPAGIPIDADSITRSLRETFSAQTPPVPPGWPEDPVPAAAAQVVHGGGHLHAAQADPLHRGAAGQRAALHRGHRDATPLRSTSSGGSTTRSPSPPWWTRCWRPGRTPRPSGSTGWATTPWSRRRNASSTRCCPASSDARRWGRRERLHREFPGPSLSLAPCRDAVDPPTATSC